MFGNRVKETTTTTGTGSLTMAGAETNFQTFNNALGQGRRFTYWIVDDTNNAWETGQGYLSAASILVREVVLGNSNGTTSALNLSGGTKDVFCSPNHASGFWGGGASAVDDWIAPYNVKMTDYRSVQAVPADTINYFPVYFGTDSLFDNLRLQITDAGTATKFRIGFYENALGRPGDLIFQTGDIDPTGGGTKIESISEINLSGRWLWGAVVQDAAITYAASDFGSDVLICISPVEDGNDYQTSNYHETATAWTVLPSSAGTLSGQNRDNVLRVQGQVA